MLRDKRQSLRSQLTFLDLREITVCPGIYPAFTTKASDSGILSPWQSPWVGHPS